MYRIGIDIGGNSTKIGIVNHNGIVHKSCVLDKEHYADINYFVEKVAESIFAFGEKEIAGIGIGAPNANYRTGTIDFPPNLPWKGITPLAGMISAKTNLPVKMTNDANAAAIGEMKFGAARGMKDFIVITLGTGIGSGIVANGELIAGHNGFAGELGHTTIHTGGRLCGCGRKGCLEAYASATGVAFTAREWLAETAEQTLLRYIPINEITAKNVYEAAIESDALALRIFEYTGNLLGEAFANFIAFSNPEAIILFGGLTRAGNLLLKPIKESVEKNVLPIYRGKTKILVSELKESDAAILGASALVT
ncbi:MAG: ROK family protein [Prevotellaceae bacterium]|jgi:glucokinase|nr:ROK family protein [Prevotellaceae bacterium]